MNYIAWSDASWKEETNEMRISYIIHDENDRVIAKYTGKVKELSRNTNDAEYFAFYLLLKKIKELNLMEENIQIYLDSLYVERNFLERQYISKRQKVNFFEEIINELGHSFYEQISPFITWKESKKNRAHQLFKDAKHYEKIKIPKKWKKPEKQFLKELPNKITLPFTSIKMDKMWFLKFHGTTKEMKNYGYQNTLNLLDQKLKEAMVVEDQGMNLYVKGQLHVYVKNKEVQGMHFQKSDWTIEYRKRKNALLLS